LYERRVDVTNKRVEDIRLVKLAKTESNPESTPSLIISTAPDIRPSALPKTIPNLSLEPSEQPSTSPQPSSSSLKVADAELQTESGIDYKPLRNLLETGSFREADVETIEFLSKMVEGREGWIDWISIYSEQERKICTDVRTINMLWEAYSNGRFGFRKQLSIWNQIYNDEGLYDRWWRQAPPEARDYYWSTRESWGVSIGSYKNSFVYDTFAGQVGWLVDNRRHLNYNDLSFTLNAPEGHLPTIRKGMTVDGRAMGWYGDGVTSFFLRVLPTCNLGAEQSF
jgi:hypothetical protein